MNKKVQQNLKQIFTKNHCDKSTRHHYHLEYAGIMDENLSKGSINILEIGIFRGESLKSWVDFKDQYYPESVLNVVAIDIFERVSEQEVRKDIGEYYSNHCTMIAGDSRAKETNQSIVELNMLFDVIIDDGLHTPRANGKTFLNLIEFLDPKGVYYIEDVWPLDIFTENEWKDTWIQTRKEIYSIDEWKFFENCLDGPYKIERIDLRSTSGNPDSYMFKVRKS